MTATEAKTVCVSSTDALTESGRTEYEERIY